MKKFIRVLRFFKNEKNIKKNIKKTCFNDFYNFKEKKLY